MSCQCTRVIRHWTKITCLCENASFVSCCRCSSEKAKAAALSFLPILTWLPSYPVKQYLFSDVVSGLSTGVVQLPQGQCPVVPAAASVLYGSHEPLWSTGMTQGLNSKLPAANSCGAAVGFVLSLFWFDCSSEAVMQSLCCWDCWIYSSLSLPSAPQV